MKLAQTQRVFDEAIGEGEVLAWHQPAKASRDEGARLQPWKGQKYAQVLRRRQALVIPYCR